MTPAKPILRPAGPRLFVATGSTSGDMLFAPVLDELRRRGFAGPVTGIGGAPLRERGVELFLDPTPYSSIGPVAAVAAALGAADEFLRTYRRVMEHFRNDRPDLVVLVDSSGSNLRILPLARRFGIPVIYYAAPEVWSLWRWELKALIRDATAVVPLLRSEERQYLARGGNIRWVGHPIIDYLGRIPPRPGLDGRPATIGLFPGSRAGELRLLAPALLGAAEIIRARMPGVRIVISTANDLADADIRRRLAEANLPAEVVFRRPHDVLAQCDLLLTSSGTATLEAAVLGIPMVVVYRLSYRFDRLIQTVVLRAYRYFSLPNYLLDREVVPELRNQDVNPQRVAEEALAVLRDPERRRAMAAGLAEVRAVLGPPGAVGRAADLIESYLHRPRADTERRSGR